MKRDYRRETQEIIEKIISVNNWTVEQLADKMEVSAFTAYRWKNGKTSPSSHTLERLKQLASGQLQSPQVTQAGGDLLAQTIAQLQQEIGELKYRLTQLEHEDVKKNQLVHHVKEQVK